jgi:hypothetical protein
VTVVREATKICGWMGWNARAWIEEPFVREKGDCV